MSCYALEPRYDGRKSFYGKALVDIQGDTKTLYSYDTKVAEVRGGKATLFYDWDYSNTTLRHVKEFLKQEGFNAYPKKDMAKHYEVKE